MMDNTNTTPCPCESCLYRKVLARDFDVYVWGEDCPYNCKEFVEWRAKHGT